LNTLQSKAASAERVGDYEKAADLKYGAIPDLQSHLDKITQEELDRRKSMAEAADPNHPEETMVSEVVTPYQIQEVISRWTGIPLNKLSQTDRDRLLHLHKRLEDRVVGQEQAIRDVCDCILRSRAGLARPNQPTGSFLFLGPTGVGKTELSKALFSELYDGDGNEQNMVRIGMREYTEAHSVARLVGAPPGYVGYEEGGQLTEAVRRKPYTVVLLDEIEKAHPRILPVLLQVMDEGRLTDGRGKTVDFTNAVVIMTSTIGAQHLLALNDDDDNDERNIIAQNPPSSENGDDVSNSKAHARVMAEVRSHFSPEFLNRLSAVILFNSLGKTQLGKIVHKAINFIQQRLKEQHNIEIELEPSGVDAILAASYDPNYGARPVERYLESTVVTTLSKLLIGGQLLPGCVVHIQASDADAEEDNTNITKRKQGASSSSTSELKYVIKKQKTDADDAT
jgi:ATP-dependent Clp protease ATP-binding subunit ClpB